MCRLDPKLVQVSTLEEISRARRRIAPTVRLAGRRGGGRSHKQAHPRLIPRVHLIGRRPGAAPAGANPVAIVMQWLPAVGKISALLGPLIWSAVLDRTPGEVAHYRIRRRPATLRASECFDRRYAIYSRFPIHRRPLQGHHGVVAGMTLRAVLPIRIFASRAGVAYLIGAPSSPGSTFAEAPGDTHSLTPCAIPGNRNQQQQCHGACHRKIFLAPLSTSKPIAHLSHHRQITCRFVPKGLRFVTHPDKTKFAAKN